MEKVNKKEIRLVYNLNNESDRKQYEFYSKNTQPGKVIKKILSNNMEHENESKSVEGDEFNMALLKVLNKLNDKIDNLSVAPVSENNKPQVEEKEIYLTGEVTTEDLDDIEF